MLIDGLQRAEAFPHEVRQLQLIETHISWVLLTGEFAYKIKKPVDLDFVDFSTPERRRHFCDEELRLNRRFAPGLYLDVVPVGGTPDRPRIGAEPAIDWAVQMRQFPPDALLAEQLDRGRASVDDLRRLGERLAGAHAAAAVAEVADYGSPDSVRGPARDNFESLASECERPDRLSSIAALREWTEAEGLRLEPAFAERVATGAIRECHGDLHAGNIVRLEGDFVPFDCLEFSPALRWIDVMSDVAFLVMDLLYRDRADLACTFLNRYLERSADYAGLGVINFYLVYRAVVRAKVAAVRRHQQQGADQARSLDAHLELARTIATARRQNLMVICHGLSGSGKTWLSEQLIPALPAIRLRSDILRKQLAGQDELARNEDDVNQGLYAPEVTRGTYAALARFAGLALGQGLNVIVDATCLRRAERRVLSDAARRAGVAAVIVHCDAPRRELEERIRRRDQLARDASEANLAVLEHQFASREPLEKDELAICVAVDTTETADPDRIAARIRGLALDAPA